VIQLNKPNATRYVRSNWDQARDLCFRLAGQNIGKIAFIREKGKIIEALEQTEETWENYCSENL
jgi:hypothetical protein